MNNENEVVLKEFCNEPTGRIERSVRLMKLSMDKLRFLKDTLLKVDVLFNDYVRGNEEALISHFISFKEDGEIEANGLMWEVDDVGMFLLNDIRPMESASAHFVFWDKRFRGREALCRAMVKYVLETYGLHRIRVEVPLYAARTLQAVDRIGFTLEGRQREAIRYKGEWFDVKTFSMLLTDFVRPMTNTGKTRMLCTSCGDSFNKQYRSPSMKKGA